MIWRQRSLPSQAIGGDAVNGNYTATNIDFSEAAAGGPTMPLEGNISWDAQNITPLWHGSVTEDPTAPKPSAKK